jgi:hypothetical protein
VNAAAQPSVTAPADETGSAGRMCPADYRCDPAAFHRPPEITADVLYVVGGLYGNLAALQAIERLAAAEPVAPTIVFNGDFHWFDAEPDWFAAIEAGIARHTAIRGNVETEIARVDDIGAGCGCAYPPSVGHHVVQRSNEILAMLRTTALARSGSVSELGALPTNLVAQVGDLRVGIVHGDAHSLAGWGFAHDALDEPKNLNWFSSIKAASGMDIFASTHTCLAALRQFAVPAGRLTIINNGAAGMPNFTGSRIGLISRISVRPSPHKPVYGTVHGWLHVDAIAVHYAQQDFLQRFLARWPAGSAAHASYFDRIVSGPDYTIGQATGPMGQSVPV